MLQWLLQELPSLLSARDVHGTTAVHWAARGGKVSILERLREAGAELGAREQHSGCTALHLMAGEGHEAAALYLLQHVPLEPDAHGLLPQALLLGMAQLGSSKSV